MTQSGSVDAIVGAVTTIAVAKILAITLAATALIVLWPLRRALGRRFDDLGERDAALRAELEDLRARVAELEERLDFAERIQAGRREPERLGQGG
ncbi:MAG TPA: hypothetical protein VLT17_00695 [Gemmatimonadales bacterium]|nr:hypothetical protein [Gemmatimonadales bacterium]